VRARHVIIRLAHESDQPIKRATLTFTNRLPADFWDKYALPFLRGEKTFGKAKKALTVTVIVADKT